MIKNVQYNPLKMDLFISILKFITPKKLLRRNLLALIAIMSFVAQVSFGQSVFVTSGGGSFPNEMWMSITTGANGTGTVVWAQGNGTLGNAAGALTDEEVDITAFCGMTLYLNAYDEYGDSWNGGTYTLEETASGPTIINNGGVSPTDGSSNGDGSGWDGPPADELETSESFTVVCLCTNPTIGTAAAITTNCNMGTFDVSMEVTTAGEGGTVTVSDGNAINNQVVSSFPTTVIFAGYAGGSSVTLNVDNGSCNLDANVVTESCACTTAPTGTAVVNTTSCGSDMFHVDVTVSTLGDAAAVTVSDGTTTDNNGGAGYAAAGIVQMGPYAAGTSVTITLAGLTWTSCSMDLTPITEDCVCDVLPTATVSTSNLDCVANTYDVSVTVDSDGSGTANASDVYIDGALATAGADVTTGATNIFSVSVGDHVITIEAEGSNFSACVSTDYSVSLACNGGDVCADAVDILGSTSSADLSVASLDAGSSLLPCFETVGNGTTLGRGNCSGAGCFEHTAYYYTNYEDLWYVIDIPDGVDEFSVNFTGLSCNVAVFPYTGTCGSLSLMDLTGGVGTGLADSDNDGTVETEANQLPFINTDGSIHFKGADVATASTGLIYLRVIGHDNNAAGAACNDADIGACAFTIGVTSPQPNDVCGDALDIDATTASGNLCSANTETENTETGATCAESQDSPDLWYEVTMGGSDSDQNLEVDLTFTGASDAVVVELYAACFNNSFEECATVTSTGAGSTVTHAFDKVITAGGFGPTWYVRVTPASGNSVCDFSILGRRIAENNNCEVMQNVFPGFDIEDTNNEMNFNFSSPSGAIPAVAGNDLWFQFDPDSGADGNGLFTGSATADIIIYGAAGVEYTLLLYKGNTISSNNCNDLADDYLETIVISPNGSSTTVELSCLDELHTSVDGGYILRVIQTAGATSTDGLIRSESNPIAPYNNDCENIWDGSGPSNLGVGDASTHFNPYFIPGNSTYSAAQFENTTDCHPDITSAECNNVDNAAITESDDRDAWFVFEVPVRSSGCDLTVSETITSMEIIYEGVSQFTDGNLYVYDGCSDADLVDCSGSLDGAAPGTSWNVEGLTQGESYLLRAKPSLTNSDFEYSFDITVNNGPVSPCNDVVSDAATLAVMTDGFDRTDGCATLTPYSAQGATNSLATGRDVWFTFTAPDNGGPYVLDEGWVTLWFESTSGHPINLEVYDEGLGDGATSRLAGPEGTSDEGYLHLGHLNPGETYWVRLYHNETVTELVQYRICAYYKDNFGSCTIDAGPTSLTPQECADDCEAWFQLDLPEGLGSAFYRIEVVGTGSTGNSSDLDLHMWFQGGDSPSGEGEATDYDHPCNQFAVGRLTPAMTGVLSDTDVSEDCTGGSGDYKIYNLIGPVVGQRNYYNIEVEDATALSGCIGLDICRLNVKGPYLTAADAAADGTVDASFCGSYDYGDLPTGGTFDFPTVSALYYNNSSAVWLGATIDGESENTSTDESAIGDGEDEDGYAVEDVETPGGTGTINVTVNGGSSGLTVHGGMWIDWMRGGDLSTADFYAFSGVTGSPTVVPVTVNVPLAFVDGVAPGFVRIIASTSPVSSDAFATDIINGEIEDHLVMPGPLPVNLISFTASKGDNNVELKWSTASEINNDRFEIEQSSDGQTFVKIGELEGKGTTSGRSDYRYIHDLPVNGINYYRLKQVDFDGKHEYSQIRNVTFDAVQVQPFSLYPNPVKDELIIRNLNPNGQVYTLEIRDIEGKSLQFIDNLSIAEQAISMSAFPSGMYYILITGDQEVNKYKVVKID